MLDAINKDARERMQKAVDVLEEELAGIRTGRATPSLLQNLRVEYYGSKVPLNQVASITAPEPNLLIVHPWDQGSIEGIEKAIMTSNLGLNPIKETNLLRIPIPPLTEERRVELTKLVKKLGEETKIAIRNIRREIKDKVKKMKNNGDISEDEELRFEKTLQEITDKFVEKVEVILTKKEEEIMND